jgi:hypothetical protein
MGWGTRIKEHTHREREREREREMHHYLLQKRLL